MIPKLHFHHLLNINVHVNEINFQFYRTTTNCKSGKNNKRQWMAFLGSLPKSLLAVVVKNQHGLNPLLDNGCDVLALLELTDE